MAKPTIAQLVAENDALRAALEAVPRDFVPREEYRRVQRVLATTQRFYAELKRKTRPAKVVTRPAKEDLDAYFAAFPDQRTVDPTTLAHWVNAR